MRIFTFIPSLWTCLIIILSNEQIALSNVTCSIALAACEWEFISIGFELPHLKFPIVLFNSIYMEGNGQSFLDWFKEYIKKRLKKEEVVVCIWYEDGFVENGQWKMDIWTKITSSDCGENLVVSSGSGWSGRSLRWLVKPLRLVRFVAVYLSRRGALSTWIC